MQNASILAIAFAAALAAAPALGRDLAAPAAATATDASLEVKFVGLEEQRGAVMFALYDTEAGYGAGKPARAEMLPVSGAEAARVLAGLKPGRYAIKAFHDLDGDGEMDANPFGIPLEPFAFSNDARGARGPASWADASFTVAPGANAARITIR